MPNEKRDIEQHQVDQSDQITEGGIPEETVDGITDGSDDVNVDRRSVLQTGITAGLATVGIPATVKAGNGPPSRERKNIATTIRSEPYQRVKQELIQSGYTPKISEATSVSLTDQIADDSGIQVRIPFKPKSDGTNSAEVTGFFREQERNIQISGIINEEDREYPTEHYSSQEIVNQSDGVLTWKYVDYRELGQYIEPQKEISSDQVTTAANVPIPGYSFKGTYRLSNICYVVSGSCFGFFLLSLANLIPGDEVAVGVGCGFLGGGCWIAETASRYSPCRTPKIKLYKRAWWNPLGPEFTGYPVC